MTVPLVQAKRRAEKGVELSARTAGEAKAVCPECGSERLVSDIEAGEVWCSSCGVQLPLSGDEDFLPLASAFGDGQTIGGMTLEHLPDKNLTTDFRPSDMRGSLEEISRFRNLRWLNHIVPQRSQQSVYRNVSLRLRPLLERVGVPSEVVNRTVLKASQIVAKNGLLRIEGAYEGLALLGLMYADRQRFLRFGRKRLFSLISNASPREICRVDLLESPGESTIRCAVESEVKDSERSWVLGLPVGEMQERPEGPCMVSGHFYYYLNVKGRHGAVCHLTGAVPVRFLLNTAQPSDSSAALQQRVAEKRRGSFYMALSAEPASFVHGRDVAIEVRANLIGEAPLKKAYVTLSNGGAFHIARKAYNSWCVFLGEPADPATIEELNELNPQIPRGLLSQVNGRAHYFKRIRSRAILQPLSDRIAAAVACYDVLVLPARQVADFYDVSECVIKAYHERLMSND